MPWLNATESVAASKNVTAAYYKELENNPAPEWVKSVFWVILSSFREEVLAFSKGVPGMREWVGERRIQSLSEYSVRVSKKDWELTVGLKRDDLEFDHFNILLPQIQGMAGAYSRHIVNDYFVKMCLGGHVVLAYDGANFFDDSHPNGTGLVYKNVTDNFFSPTEFAIAKKEAAKIKNPDSGAPLSIRYTHAFYAPNAETAIDTTFSQKQTGGTDNLNYNKIPETNRIRVDEFGDSNIVLLFDLSKTLKPFALQVVKGLNFVPFDKPDDWIVFMKKEFVYGQDSMDNAAYVLPELAYAFRGVA